MEKAKFYVDFCFEAGDAGLCHRYWFEIELSSEEFEELYQIWFDQNCELNSWATDWEGHDALFQKINDAAIYALNKCLEKENPVYQNPLDVLWELSPETKDAF
jgi:nitrate reductase assembly molybdenum cofactor insertion protein NarJ